ncbi:MAG TPA: MAE_28990/MAE_18760 family HEPN-like nuclease [Thermoanaerobaculia bacterium]|nr:MAE_28990/MAE_18760 family HEPN-like nuclease [Thermoanaerobaculia bacterium]
MKIRSRENLVDIVGADLAWRKKELSILIGTVGRYQRQPIIEETLLRSAIPILYAHWEGFVKVTAGAYLEYVGRKGVPYAELSAPFVAWAVRSELRRVGETQKVSRLIGTVSLLADRSTEASQLPWRAGVETKSNLNSDVFRDIVISLGLDYSPYESKEKLVDGTLLHYRNHIAHGRGLYLDFSRYSELHREILDLMETFRNQVENAALMGHYSRIPAKWAAL